MNKKFDLILFDLDGTVFDTANTILNSLKATVKNAGLRELTKEEVDTFIGPPIIDSLHRYYPEMSDEEIDDLTKAYRKYYIDHELLKAKPFDKIPEIIKTLKENNYKVALATYKLMKCVTPLFDYYDMTKYFDTLRGSINEKGLTKTDIMRLAIEDCKVTDYNKVCMIGDTEHDLRGAINLGVSFIGVKYGAGFKGLSEEEKNYKKIIGFVDRAEEILNLV